MKYKIKKLISVFVICFMICSFCPVTLAYGLSPVTTFDEVSYVKNSNADTATMEIALNGFAISQIKVDEDVLTESTTDADGNYIEKDYITYINIDDECFLTLEFSYLDSLAAGAHNVTVSYEDASEETTVKLNIKDWGKVKLDSDILSFVDEEGVTSAEIRGGGIIWLQDDSSDAIFGLDNEERLFEDGARFKVQFIDRQETADDWNTHYLNLDEKYKAEFDTEKSMMFDLGVDDLKGLAYSELDKEASVYVELPDDWDSNDLGAVYIGDGEDEPIDVTLVEKEILGEEKSFVRLNLNHFSPYMIYEKTDAQDSSDITDDSDVPTTPANPTNPNVPNTADGNNMEIYLFLGTMALLGIAICNNFPNSKRNKRHHAEVRDV